MLILLTNDDGWQSELLPLAVERLRSFGDLIIVAPSVEQSWKGKSMVRDGLLKAVAIEVSGIGGFAVDGTPADCVNLAVHQLCPQRPDLVVSGINVGENTGLSYAFSSGTIGACFEANIAGVPAVALSQSLTPELFSRVRKEGCLPAVEREWLWRQSGTLLSEALGLLLADPPLLSAECSWSINFPRRPVAQPELRLARLGWDRYGSRYKKGPEGFVSGLMAEYNDGGDDTERALLERGFGTVALLEMGALARPPGAMLTALQQRLRESA